MTLPSGDAQIDFLVKIQRIQGEGSFTSTWARDRTPAIGGGTVADEPTSMDGLTVVARTAGRSHSSILVESARATPSS